MAWHPVREKLKASSWLQIQDAMFYDYNVKDIVALKLMVLHKQIK